MLQAPRVLERAAATLSSTLNKHGKASRSLSLWKGCVKRRQGDAIACTHYVQIVCCLFVWVGLGFSVWILSITQLDSEASGVSWLIVNRLQKGTQGINSQITSFPLLQVTCKKIKAKPSRKAELSTAFQTRSNVAVPGLALEERNKINRATGKHFTPSRSLACKPTGQILAKGFKSW